jgi:superoxide dismutase, Cu-Zn family
MKLRRLAPAFVVSFLGAACGGSGPEAAAPTAAPPASAAPAAAVPPAASAPEAAAPAAPAASAASAPTAAAKALSVAFAAKSDSKLTGTATLTEEAGGVKVVLALEGLTPGEHGTHVHETADCSAPDAKSAGSHYNPDKHDHGLPTVAARHLGDLGNVTVGKDGKGKLEILIPGANLKPNDPHSFLGRSIIVHEKKDDGGQPVGNAGGRIGCAALVSE